MLLWAREMLLEIYFNELGNSFSVSCLLEQCPDTSLFDLWLQCVYLALLRVQVTDESGVHIYCNIICAVIHFLRGKNTAESLCCFAAGMDRKIGRSVLAAVHSVQVNLHQRQHWSKLYLLYNFTLYVHWFKEDIKNVESRFFE